MVGGKSEKEIASLKSKIKKLDKKEDFIRRGRIVWGEYKTELKKRSSAKKKAAKKKPAKKKQSGEKSDAKPERKRSGFSLFPFRR